jgi:predicted ArsR family transcriptional regulator
MIRKAGSLSISEIATELGVTHEALRQTLRRMKRSGLVAQFSRTTGKKGRPAFGYQTTPLGDRTFELPLEDLVSTLLDLVDPETAIEALAQTRVALWRERLEGMTHEEKLEALRDIHQLDDPFMDSGRSQLTRLFPAYWEQLSDTSLTCEAARRAIEYLLVNPVEHTHPSDGTCVYDVRESLAVAQQAAQNLARG